MSDRPSTGENSGRVRTVLRFLSWAGLLSVGMFVLFIGGNYPWLGSQVVRVATQAVTVVVLGVWLTVALALPAWRPSRAAVLPVALGLAAGTLSTIASERPRLSLESLLVGFAVGLAYLFVRRLAADRWFRPRLTQVLILLPALVSMTYVIQVGRSWLRWWMLVGGPALPPLRPAEDTVTFGAPTIVGAVLVLMVPLACGLLAARRPTLWPAVALAAIGFIATLITGSRGAFIGFGTGALALVLLTLTSGVRWRRHPGGKLRMPSRRMILGATAALVLVLAVLSPVLVNRILEPGGTDQRLDFWRAAFALFGRDPIFGSGPGTWAQLKFAVNPIGSPNLVVPHAHDLYIQTLAEVGLVGAAAMTVLVLVIGRRLVVATRSADRELRLGATGAIVGLAGFGGQSLVDNFINLPSLCLLLILVVVWAEAGQAGELNHVSAPVRFALLRIPRRVGGMAVVATLVAVVAVLPVVGRIDHAALLADDGTRAAIDGDWTSAWASWDRALAEDPDMTLYRLERGIASANLGDLAAATTDLGDVVQVDPYPVHLVSLARLEADAGDRDGALSDAALALDRDATDPVVALNVGAIAERLNDAPLARRGYSEAIAGFPELAAAAYWREAGRLTELPNILSAAREVVRGWGLAGAAESAAAIRAYGGDPAGALVEASALPDSRARDRTIALCIWLEGRPSEAIDLLRATLRAYPRDAPTADLLSRLLAGSGDGSGAAHYREWADILAGGGPAQASVTGTEVMTVRQAGTSGVAPNYPWMIYLRRAPAVLTPPDALVISGP